MSWQACAWADSLEHYLVGPLEFRVLLKLANVSNADGTIAFRNKSEIASELGVHQKTVQKALRALEMAMLIAPGDQEYVHHIRADKRPTVYELNFRYKTQYAQPELPWDGADERGSVVIHNPERGSPDSSSGGASMVPQGTVVNELERFKESRHSTRAGTKGGGHAPAPSFSNACPEDPSGVHQPASRRAGGLCLRCGAEPTGWVVAS